MMVPLIISNDGAVHKDTVRRWKSFSPDIEVDLVRMAQNVIRYNVMIVGKFSTKGAGAPKRGKGAPRKEEEEPDGPLERITNAEEIRERLSLERDPESAVCAAPGHATSTRRTADVRRKGKPANQKTRTNQPT